MNETGEKSKNGTIINERYRVLERLGQGSMGSVYRGEQIQLGKTVAIKFLRKLHLTDERTRARFVREAHAMSKLSHPHCVSVIDYGIADAPYIVMDYVTGKALEDIIRHESVTFERAIRLVLQILAGLAHAHNRGIIHRDIKPENIIVNVAAGTGEQARIVDFSLAKMTDSNSQSLTGAIIGTPAYMSPEQAVGDHVDLRTDLYSVGVIIFELLTGKKPFLGKTVTETLNMQLHTAAPTLGEVVPDISFSDGLEALVKKALAKSREERFSSAYALMEALAAIPESGNSGEIIALPNRTPQFDDSAETIDLPPNLAQPHLAQPASTRTAAASVDTQGARRSEHVALNQQTVGPAKQPAGWKPVALGVFFVLALLLIVLVTRVWNASKPDPVGETEYSAGQAAEASSIQNAKTLIAAGEVDRAISALQKIRASYPSSSEPPYLLGNLFSIKQWWSAAVKRYKDAIDLNPAYKKDPLLNQNLIRALGNKRARLAAAKIIVEQVGPHAIPHLKNALEGEKSVRIRRRVARILEDMSHAGPRSDHSE